VSKGWADPGQRDYTASNRGVSSSQIPLASAQNAAPLPPDKPPGLAQTGSGTSMASSGGEASRFERSQLASNDESPDDASEGLGGIPKAAHQFLKTRLVPEEYAQFLKVLRSAANPRPLAGDSMRVMEHRRPDGKYYYSPSRDACIGRNGIATRRPLPQMDTSRAERELQDIISGARR